MATQRTQIFLEGVALDLDKNVDIDFTYSIADIADFEKRKTTFSETVSIPATAHNSFLFGNYFDFNIENDYSDSFDNVGVNFNPMKKAFVSVAVDNVEIFAGVLRLLEIKYTGSQMYYECALFGSLGGLFTTIGEKVLTDLDLSDLSHTYNIATIKGTWTDPAATYIYPLSQYGIGTNATDSTYDVLNLRPAIKVKELCNRIITEAGYTYNSEIWDDNHLDNVIVLNNEETFSGYYSSFGSVLYNGGNAGDFLNQDLALTFASTSVNYLAVDIVTGGYHRIKNISSSPITVKIQYTLKYSTYQAGFVKYIWSQVRNDSSIGTVIQTIKKPIPRPSAAATVVVEAEFFLNPNDGINAKISGDRVPPSSGGTTFVLDTTSGFTATVKDSNTKIPVIYNSVISGKSIVPDSIKQSDLLKSVINLLNLYVIQDKDNEFNLTFLPFPDFNIDETVEWTDKKDLTSGFSIKPPSDYVSRTYSFKYKDDVDYYSKIYKNKYGSNYGNLQYETGNDFSKDDNSTEFIFSLAPSISNSNHDRILPAMFDINTDGTYKQIKTNPKLAFYGGVKSSSVSYTIKNGITTLGTETTYPYAGHVYDPLTVSDGTLWDLVFGIPKEVYFSIEDYPTINLFKTYYEQFLTDKSSKDSKLVTLYFLLNTVDIMNIDFRKLYKVNNGLYYLNKIDGYNPLSNDLTRVELIRKA